MTLMGHEATEQAPGGSPADLLLPAGRRRALAAALAGLGPVLLLECAPPAPGGDAGCDERLAQACARGAVVARATVDPFAGSHEELALPGLDGIVHMRLVRLPESDWLGWDRALAHVGAWVEMAAAAPPSGAADRGATIRRAMRRQPTWRARPVCLQLVDESSRPLQVQPLAHCSWAALRVIEALRARESVQLAGGG